MGHKRRVSAGPFAGLSRRERQIMEVVFRLGRATAAEVHERIPDPPTQTAVRTMLRNLEAKGQLRHEEDGPRHVYLPTTPAESVRQSALKSVLGTFFGGSPMAAMAALLDLSERELSEAERQELVDLIGRSRARGE